MGTSNINNPMLDVVNVNKTIKFGQITFIHTQDNEHKRNSDVTE